MFDQDLERIKLACVIDNTEIATDKKIKRNLIKKINKAIYLQAIFNSIDANEFTKNEFPYHPTSVTKFCEWENKDLGLVKFGRSTFVNRKRERNKILEDERLEILDIAEKLMAKLSEIKKSATSATQQVITLREQKEKLEFDKAALVKQLLELRDKNKRLHTKSRSLYLQIDRLKEQLKKRSATVQQIGERP